MLTGRHFGLWNVDACRLNERFYSLGEIDIRASKVSDSQGAEVDGRSAESSKPHPEMERRM